MDAVYDMNRLFSSKYLLPVGSWFLEMKAAYSSIDHQMDNHSKPTFAKVDAVTTTDTETWVMKTELSGRLGPWNVVFGADHQSNSKSGQRVKLIKMGPMAGNTVVDEVFAEGQLLDTGLYAEGSRSFDSSRITTGLRLHRNNASADRPDPELTGSTDIPDQANTLVAMTFSYSKDFSDNTTMGIATALGHRTPSITERYIYMFPVGIDAYDYIGDPELNPESMWQTEVFYQFRTDRINFNMSIFYSDIKDSINAEVIDRTPRTAGVPGVKQFINVPDAYRYGFNASMTWAITHSLQLACNLGETRGYDETHDEDLPQIPPLEMSHTLKYTRKSLTAQWKWRWVDSKDKPSERFVEIPTDSFSVHTFRAGYEHKSLGFFLEVQNVLDETYSEFLYRNIFKTDKRMTAPGRMMVLRVTKRF
jgi:iron complex outermembrane receptor protein